MTISCLVLDVSKWQKDAAIKAAGACIAELIAFSTLSWMVVNRTTLSKAALY